MTPINTTQLVLNTLFIWNDYSTAIILLREKESKTLTLAQIQYFNGKKLDSDRDAEGLFGQVNFFF